jgi:hypothetical protein
LPARRGLAIHTRVGKGRVIKDLDNNKKLETITRKPEALPTMVISSWDARNTEWELKS